jgi:hypothetical protein
LLGFGTFRTHTTPRLAATLSFTPRLTGGKLAQETTPDLELIIPFGLPATLLLLVLSLLAGRKYLGAIRSYANSNV